MPADGDALLARITAGPGAGDAAGLGAAAAAYVGRVASLRKTGKAGQAFSADDARKEGGVLVKLFSAAIKQQVCGPGPRALCPRLHDAVLRRCGGRPARLEQVVNESCVRAAHPFCGGGASSAARTRRVPGLEKGQ